jgi:chemotaxis protein MotB
LSDDEEEKGGAWLISFADLMTLLFAAFVVLYGITPEGVSKSMLGVLAEIREELVDIPDTTGKDLKPGPQHKGKFVFKAYYGETGRKDQILRSKIKDDVKVRYDQDKGAVDNMLDQMAKTKKGYDFGLRMAMATSPHETGFAIKLMAGYFFKPAEYHLSREGYARLVKIGDMIRRIGRPFTIEGHTDSEPPGKGLSNYDLGALRSGYAAKVLMTENHISSFLVDTVSFADSQPLADNKSPEGRSQNRRIEIKVHYY